MNPVGKGKGILERRYEALERFPDALRRRFEAGADAASMSDLVVATGDEDLDGTPVLLVTVPRDLADKTGAYELTGHEVDIKYGWYNGNPGRDDFFNTRVAVDLNVRRTFGRVVVLTEKGGEHGFKVGDNVMSVDTHTRDVLRCLQPGTGVYALRRENMLGQIMTVMEVAPREL